MATAAESSAKFARVLSSDLITSGRIASYSGRTPAFEDILGALVADIHRLHAHVQQRHELDSRMYDIERITSEDIEETVKRAHVVNTPAWTFGPKNIILAKVLSEVKMHLQHGVDTLYRTEMLLFLVAIHLKGFLQGGSGQISGAQEPLPIHTERHIRETVASALFEPMSSLEHLELDTFMHFDAASSQHAFFVLLIRKIRAIVDSEVDM